LESAQQNITKNRKRKKMERMGDSVTIPYFAHEGEMTRMERANKRLWVIIIILIVALIGTNAGWLYYESQFSEEVTTVEQQVDTGEGMAIVSGIGDAIYGESDSESDGQTESESVQLSGAEDLP
jgi:flagellar basal body-associated protein FliL